MTDDEILETLDRRLAGVETRLPPTRVAPAADLVAVRTRLGGSLRPGAPALLVLAVVTAVAVGVGSRLSGGVGGEASPSVVDPSAVAVASDVPPSSTTSSPSPTPFSSPAPSAADLEVIRDVKFDGMHVLTQRMGWGPCLMSSESARVLADGRAIDRAIDDAGIEQGFVEVAETWRLWIGSTPESAARAHGSPILVIGRTGSWIVVDDDALGLIGRELIRIDTPKGRTAWYLGDMVGETACTDG